jgi:hypothetical protein
MTSHAFAKLIQCPGMVLVAGEDQEKDSEKYEAWLRFDPQNKNPDKSQVFKEYNGQKVDLDFYSKEDEDVKGLYEYTGAVSVNGVKENYLVTVLKKSKRKGGIDHIGPEGAQQYRFLADGSLTELSWVSILTGSAFKVLKTYGLTRSRNVEYTNIKEAADKAVEANQLKKGQVIGIGLAYGCFSE